MRRQVHQPTRLTLDDLSAPNLKVNFDPANMLLTQAHREVLERQLEFSRLADGLRRMRETPVLLRQTHKPSPFAFPIMVSRFREKLSSEKLADRVRRMQLEFDKAAQADEGEQGDLFG